jgi:predicted secreted protein
MKTKLLFISVLALAAALLISLAGMASAAAPAAGSGPQEVQVTEQGNGQNVEVNGEVLVLNLASNPSTGYGWQVKGLNNRILRLLEASDWIPDTQGKLGGPGTQVLRFAAVGKGQTSLNLVYTRRWKNELPAETFSIDVIVTETSTNVSYPLPAAHLAPEAASPEATIDALPSTYNWCSLGGCTPVRDQGNCGSCWAFGTVGSLESAILLQDGASRDLAEQYLVSCNTDGWGCDGGFWAHDYHEWKFPTNEPGPGAVYESDFPYTATDAPCNGPHTHHETIADWVYIGNDSSVPSTDAIKQAILDHGPVSAAVCVNSAFQAYTGGVFTGSPFCFSINHAIVLVGWDDSKGAWRLRNSWGPEWGEDGYMWIAYGKQYVGYSANYVVYAGSTPPTPPAAPTSLTATAASYSQINLAWTDNATDETGFYIERCTGEGCSEFAQVATVGANVTSYANTGLAASTSYSYRVRASNGAGDSDYSNTASAVTLDLPTPPAAPSGLAATAVSSSQINLAWTDNSTDETGLKIERCTGAGCADFTQIATVTANTTSYSNTGLSASTSYSYRVRATNAGGDSDYSNTATAVTQAAPVVPAAPTNLVTTAVSKSQINLSWKDNATNETGFKIERCKGATCTNFAQVATVGENVTSFANTGLTANTTYRFRVRAYNASGNSAYSNTVSAKTLRR